VSANKLLGVESAGVNLVAEDNYESEEDEEWWVGTIRVEPEEEEEEALVEVDKSESEQETWHSTSLLMRKNDSGLEEEFEYFWEAHVPSDPDEREEDRWWNPGSPESSSGEDEEEVQYLTKILQLEPQRNETGQGKPHAPPRAAPRAGAGNGGLQGSKPDRGLPKTPERKGPAGRKQEPARTSKTKRRKLRKKVARDEDYQWESVMQDAWLRGMLTDSSGSESEEK
jgi:hypothetical protein